MSDFIPYAKQSISEADIDTVVKVLRSDFLTAGPAIDNFEALIAKTTTAPYVVACANGTAALHLSLLALGVGVGDKVFVPAVTFLSTANSVRFVGGIPVLVDVCPQSGLMRAEDLAAAIAKEGDDNSVAVINVHLAGQCGDLDAIQRVAKKANLFIIDDAAHAIGTDYIADGCRHPIGSNAFCDLTTFSFHPVKSITSGEGGAITCKDKAIEKRLRLFLCHGMERDPNCWQSPEQGIEQGMQSPWYYEMQLLGLNYRLSDIHAALGCNQLKQLSAIKQQRAAIVSRYDDQLSTLAGVKPLAKNTCSDSCWHLYVVLIDFTSLGLTRTELMQQMRAAGIGSQVHYIPLYRQPYYQTTLSGHYPGSEMYYQQCLSLPLYVGLTKQQQDRVINALIQCLNKGVLDAS